VLLVGWTGGIIGLHRSVSPAAYAVDRVKFRRLTAVWVCLHSAGVVMDLSLCAQCHCLAARRSAREITRHFEAELRRHGLRATQFSILAALALAGTMPTGGLANLVGLERTTLTRSATLLARDGWVRVKRSRDGRERRLVLTASGRRKLEKVYPSWKAAQDSAARKFHIAPPPKGRSY
jgi:DNA-binding MarR family transcriptional regulator